jgi:hypothetical protein
MATASRTTEYGAGAPSSSAAPADQDAFIKKAVQKVVAPSGVDKEGKPDGSLSIKQVNRAATEAMIAMRPQPTSNEMNYVYHKLAEADDEGFPKNKYKDTDSVIAAVKGFVEEGRKAA